MDNFGKICNQFFSNYAYSPNGRWTHNNSTNFLVEFSIKKKMGFFIAEDKSTLNSIFSNPLTFPLFSKIVSVKIPIVSLGEMLLKAESRSRLPMKHSDYWTIVTSQRILNRY